MCRRQGRRSCELLRSAKRGASARSETEFGRCAPSSLKKWPRISAQAPVFITSSTSSSSTMPAVAMKLLRVDFADAGDVELGLLRHGDDVGHAILRFQHLPVLRGIGEERHRHHIGFRTGALGQAVDHVEGACREAPREAAEKRNELRVVRRNAGHQVDGRSQRAAMADADHAGSGRSRSGCGCSAHPPCRACAAAARPRRCWARLRKDEGRRAPSAALRARCSRRSGLRRRRGSGPRCGRVRSAGAPWCSARREVPPLRLASCRRRNAARRRARQARPPRPPAVMAGAASTPGSHFVFENFFLRCNIFQISFEVNKIRSLHCNNRRLRTWDLRSPSTPIRS